MAVTSFIVNCPNVRGLSYIWRIRADGREPPERIEAAGLGALRAKDDASSRSWILSRDRSDEDVYRYEVRDGSLDRF